MATINVLKNEILNGAYDERFKRVYVTDEAVKEQYERYVGLANDFAEKIRLTGKNVSLRRMTIGPVIGAHAGPGTIGIIFVKK